MPPQASPIQPNLERFSSPPRAAALPAHCSVSLGSHYGCTNPFGCLVTPLAFPTSMWTISTHYLHPYKLFHRVDHWNDLSPHLTSCLWGKGLLAGVLVVLLGTHSSCGLVSTCAWCFLLCVSPPSVHTLLCCFYLFILLHEILSILRAAVELKFGSSELCRGWHGPCSANIRYMNLRVFV